MEDEEKMLKISTRDCIRTQMIKNLLTAQERAAENGDASAAIRLSKYLLRFLKQDDKLLVQFGTEKDEQRRSDPVEQLK